MRRYKLLILSIFLSFNSLAQDNPGAFVTGSLTEMIREKKSFILSFWSLDCPSCIKEMHAIEKQLKAHPDMKIVMVSTDEFDDWDVASAMLEKQGLKNKVESWIFSHEEAQKLRYEIDPTWFGELPRSYFYNNHHERTAHSGVLTEDQINAWYLANKK